jgi:hypothetical protein
VGIWELYKLIMRKEGQLKVNKNKITNCFNETGPGRGIDTDERSSSLDTQVCGYLLISYLSRLRPEGA